MPNTDSCEKMLGQVDLHQMHKYVTATVEEGTPRQSNQDTHPPDEVAAILNEPVVYMADKNDRNPSRKAKQQQDLLKDYFNHFALAGRRKSEM